MTTEPPSKRKPLSAFLQWIKTHPLTIEERNLCTGALLDGLRAIPLSAIISANDEGEILISGQEQNLDRLKVLREYANAALQNKTLNLVWEQVRWVAFKEGLATGLSSEELLFYRAALWFADSLKQQLVVLAGTQELPLE